MVLLERALLLAMFFVQAVTLAVAYTVSPRGERGSTRWPRPRTLPQRGSVGGGSHACRAMAWGSTDVGPLGLNPSAWPPLQKSSHHAPSAAGMRVVFITLPGAQLECTGNDVFTPARRAGPRRNQVCPLRASPPTSFACPRK